MRIEYGTVISFADGIFVLDVAGTIETLHLTPFTEVLGDLGAATLVHADGHRADYGSVIAERVEVVCPDSARG